MDNTVQYQIAITKTGTGAAEATQELKNLQSAAAAAAGSTSTVSSAMHTQKEASKLAGESIKVLNETCMIAGMSGFPQLGLAVGAVRSEMNLARGAAQLTGLSLGAVNVAVVGLVAVVGTGAAAWSQYKAELKETESIANRMGTEDRIADRLRDRVTALEQANRLTREQAEAMRFLLAAPSFENIRTVQQQLRPIVGDRNQEDAVNRLRELNQLLIGETLEGFEKEKFAAAEKYRLQMEQIEALRQKAGSQADVDTISSMEQHAFRGLDVALEGIDLRRAEANAREEAQIVQEYNRQTEEANDAIDELYAGIQRDRAAETAVMIREFDQEQTLAALQSGEDRIAGAGREYQAKVDFYRRLFQEGRITTEQLTDLDNRALINKLQNAQRFEQRYQLHTMTLQEMNVQIAESFAGGMSNAFVAFVSGTKSAEQAFKEFAASFLQMIAQMILQQLILNALKSSGIFGFAGGGTAMAASGGVFPTYAASGLAGVSEVSAATYFPKFNVVAGEAGREMLTVLAKPRMMSIGGMDAVVGNAGNNRLAITDADALARRGGGAGGTIVVEVRGTKDFEARVVSTSVEGAVVRVQNDMATDSQLARVTKNLVS